MTWNGKELLLIVDKACGIVGFVWFLMGYYLILITKKKRVASFAMHTIYEIEETRMVKLFHSNPGADT